MKTQFRMEGGRLVLHDAELHETHAVDEVPDYFPDLRERLPELFRVLPEDVINRACLLMIATQWRRTLRQLIDKKEALGFGSWPPGRSVAVTTLFIEAGLVRSRATVLAGQLARCYRTLTDHDQEVLRPHVQWHQRWARMVDSVIESHVTLKAKGIKRPAADPWGLAKAWKLRASAGAMPELQLLWDEIERYGLDKLNVSKLKRLRNKPAPRR